MAAKLFLRPHHCLSLPFFSHQPFIAYPLYQLIHLKPLCSSALTSITTVAATTELLSSLPYGPSLRKGTVPFQSQSIESIKREGHVDEDTEHLFDEANFTRVFDIAALRVPSNDCHLLESRLRGHLLNWPRVRNIARVPGDEIDPEVEKLIGSQKEGNLETLERRISGKAEGDGDELSPVLHREKLANEFDSRGYVNFKNLSKISRPKNMKKKKEDDHEKKKNVERERRAGKSEFVMVEVDDDEEDEGEDFRGLLGDDFVRRRWRGSTRLLLLDERYAKKGIDELPEAIKAMLRETREVKLPDFELVSCKLTLLYDYWSMNEILEVLLPEGMAIPSAFETVGHIAHLNLRDEHHPYKKIIAKVIRDKNKAKIRTVVNKIDSIHNDYRTMQLEVLAGNHSLVTTVIENGLKFNIDLALVYWNSRLGTERQRLLSGFTRSDVVCDVFCGVGPIAISAARIVKRVYANDLNPHAINYLDRNCVLNKLERKIKVFNMDGRRFIRSMFSSEKGPSVTQVIMNLPNDAAEYLDAFKGIYRARPRSEIQTFPKIHVYGFSKARDPEFEFHERIRIALSEVAVDVEMRKVRLVAPGKWMLCATFSLPQSVAFANIEPTDF